VEQDGNGGVVQLRFPFRSKMDVSISINDAVEIRFDSEMVVLKRPAGVRRIE
jgi:hypothetical protein